jgi:hypothetical protein
MSFLDFRVLIQIKSSIVSPWFDRMANSLAAVRNFGVVTDRFWSAQGQSRRINDPAVMSARPQIAAVSLLCSELALRARSRHSRAPNM